VIASQGRLAPANPGNTSERAVTEDWNRHQADKVQPALAKISSRGRLVALDGQADGDVIVRAVQEIVRGLVRGKLNN
jgi:hypothetical protein